MSRTGIVFFKVKGKMKDATCFIYKPSCSHSFALSNFITLLIIAIGLECQCVTVESQCLQEVMCLGYFAKEISHWPAG